MPRFDVPILSDLILPEKRCELEGFNTGAHPSIKLLIATPPELVLHAGANQVARQASEEGGDDGPEPIKGSRQVATAE